MSLGEHVLKFVTIAVPLSSGSSPTTECHMLESLDVRPEQAWKVYFTPSTIISSTVGLITSHKIFLHKLGNFLCLYK